MQLSTIQLFSKTKLWLQFCFIICTDCSPPSLLHPLLFCLHLCLYLTAPYSFSSCLTVSQSFQWNHVLFHLSIFRFFIFLITTMRIKLLSTQFWLNPAKLLLYITHSQTFLWITNILVLMKLNNIYTFKTFDKCRTL